jgi:hypothetical protein
MMAVATGMSYVIHYVNFGVGYGRHDTELSNLSIFFRVLTESRKISATEYWSRNLGKLALPPLQYNSVFREVTVTKGTDVCKKFPQGSTALQPWSTCSSR